MLLLPSKMVAIVHFNEVNSALCVCIMLGLFNIHQGKLQVTKREVSAPCQAPVQHVALYVACERGKIVDLTSSDLHNCLF